MLMSFLSSPYSPSESRSCLKEAKIQPQGLKCLLSWIYHWDQVLRPPTLANGVPGFWLAFCSNSVSDSCACLTPIHVMQRRWRSFLDMVNP